MTEDFFIGFSGKIRSANLDNDDVQQVLILEVKNAYYMRCHACALSCLSTGTSLQSRPSAYFNIVLILPPPVISCGRNNAYGHPNDDLLSRLRDAEVSLYRTDMQGTITCTSDGNTVSFTVERNAGIETNPTVQETGESDVELFYIGNINSLKFHRPSCSGLPNDKNRVILETREYAISEGFDPCGICKP